MKPPVLYGEHELTIDDKSRLLIPSEVRRSINPEVHGDGLYMVVGMNSVPWLYPERYYDELIAQAPQEMVPETDLLAFDQLHFALASKLEPDKQGRVVIPEKNLRRLGIRKDVTMVGVRDHLELWNREDWDAHREQLEAKRAEILAAKRQQMRRAPVAAPAREL